LLLAGIVANLAAYLPSSLAGGAALNAREFAPVLPFAAVLAARALADRFLPGGDPPNEYSNFALAARQLPRWNAKLEYSYPPVSVRGRPDGKNRHSIGPAPGGLRLRG
jgi:hypothetical protein